MGREQRDRYVLTLAWTLALGLIVLTGCGRNAMIDERNVYYVRGMKLRDQKRHEEAAEAFKTCLRLSPRSAKAHLQLALIYEEPLDDPLQCVYHYRMFLDMRPDDPNVEVVKDWLEKAEKNLVQTLAAARPGTPDTQSQPPAPGRSPHDSEREREEGLRRQIRDLASRNLSLHSTVAELKRQLQEQLAAARTQLSGEQPSPQPDADPSDNRRPRRHAQEPAAPPPTPSESPPATPTPTPPRLPLQYHRVARGDTLSSLSRRYYGNLKYWPLLRDYNQAVLHGRDTLRLGEVIAIPPLETLEKAQQH